VVFDFSDRSQASMVAPAPALIMFIQLRCPVEVKRL